MLWRFPWSSFLLFYVYEWFCSHVCLYPMSAWCPWRPEKGIRSPGTRITDEGAENQTRSLASAGGALDHWAPSPALSCVVPAFVLLSAVHFRVDSGTHTQCQSAVQCLWAHNCNVIVIYRESRSMLDLLGVSCVTGHKFSVNDSIVYLHKMSLYRKNIWNT